MRKQAERFLLEHGAPTLAGIKTASMFRLKGTPTEREDTLAMGRAARSARSSRAKAEHKNAA